MRESRSLGSVRGAVRKDGPYRDHPVRLAVAGDAFQQVVQLGVFGYLRLHVEQAPGRVDSRGEQQGGGRVPGVMNANLADSSLF